jgi:hypothetical protein
MMTPVMALGRSATWQSSSIAKQPLNAKRTQIVHVSDYIKQMTVIFPLAIFPVLSRGFQNPYCQLEGPGRTRFHSAELKMPAGHGQESTKNHGAYAYIRVRFAPEKFSRQPLRVAHLEAAETSSLICLTPNICQFIFVSFLLPL